MPSRTSPLVLVAAPSFAVSLTTAVWSLDGARAASLNDLGARFSDPIVNFVGNKAVSVVSRDAPSRNTLAEATSAARNFGADLLISNAWAKERVSGLAAEAGGRDRAGAMRALANNTFSADRASLEADARAVEHFVLAQTDSGYADSVVIHHSDARPVDRPGSGRDIVPAVPEPASALVFGLGTLAVGTFLIKRRRAGALANTTPI